MLAEYNMTVKVGDDNCYEVVNEAGDVLEVPFGTLLNEWGPLIRWFARRTPCQN